jgi:hypothetical protein
VVAKEAASGMELEEGSGVSQEAASVVAKEAASGMEWEEASAAG